MNGRLSPPEAPTASAYILPGAVDPGATAFGDEPVVIHKGERLFTMNTIGATGIHCSIHPQMHGTLVVREP